MILGAFIRPPFPLFCAEAYPNAYKKSSTQVGARFAKLKICHKSKFAVKNNFANL